MANIFNGKLSNNIAVDNQLTSKTKTKSQQSKKASAIVDTNVKLKLKDTISLIKSIKDGKQAGLTMQLTLSKVAETHSNKNVRAVVGALHHYVMNGDPLHEAMARFPNAFPGFICNLIEAAQLSGKWTSRKVNGTTELGVLDMLINFLKRSETARRRLVTGLVYPAILLAVIIAGVVALSFIVLPTIKDMFVALDVYKSLSPISHTMFNVADWVTVNYYIVPIVIGALAVGIKLFWDMTGKQLWQYYQLRLKFIDNIFMNFILGESLSLLAILYGSGLTILQSLDILSRTCRNPEVGGAFELARVYIESEGETLSDALKRAHFIFDGETFFRVSRGEQTGNLEENLRDYSEELFEKLDEQIDTLIKSLEPAVIVVGGVAIGLIAISFYGSISGAIAAIR